MNGADRVRSFQRPAELLDDFHHLLWGQLLFAQQHGAQIFTLDKLHRYELHPVGFAEVINADHVAVRHLAGNANGNTFSDGKGRPKTCS